MPLRRFELRPTASEAGTLSIELSGLAARAFLRLRATFTKNSTPRRTGPQAILGAKGGYSFAPGPPAARPDTSLMIPKPTAKTAAVPSTPARAVEAPSDFMPGVV